MSDPNRILCSGEVKQIIEYINGNKDTEVRKTKPHPKNHTGKSLEESTILLKLKGTNMAFLEGEVEEVHSGDPEDLYDKFSEEFKFGISKERYDSYYSNTSNNAVLVKFGEIRFILPPIEDLPGSQSWRYVEVSDYDTIEFQETSLELKEELVSKVKEVEENAINQIHNPNMSKLDYLD